MPHTSKCSRARRSQLLYSSSRLCLPSCGLWPVQDNKGQPSTSASAPCRWMEPQLVRNHGSEMIQAITPRLARGDPEAISGPSVQVRRSEAKVEAVHVEAEISRIQSHPIKPIATTKSPLMRTSTERCLSTVQIDDGILRADIRLQLLQ